MIDILVVHDKLRTAADPMPSNLFVLDLGNMSLAEARQKGKLAKAIQNGL